MKKRILATLLAAVLVIGLVPMAALAGGYVAPNHAIWIEVGEDPRTEVDVATGESQSGDGWSWNGTTKTLRLENFVGKGLEFGGCGNITLELVGDNIVGRDGDRGFVINDGNDDQGYAAGDCLVLIKGDGSLTANRVTIERIDNSTVVAAILESGTWTVDPATCPYTETAIVLAGGTLTVQGGSLSASGGKYGIRVSNVYESTLNAISGEITLEGSVAALIAERNWWSDDVDDGVGGWNNPFEKVYMDIVGGETKEDTTALEIKKLLKVAEEADNDGTREHELVITLTAGELTLKDGDGYPWFNGAAKYAKLTADSKAGQLARPKNLEWGVSYDPKQGKTVWDWHPGMSWEVDGPCDGIFRVDIYFAGGGILGGAYVFNVADNSDLFQVGNKYYTRAYRKYGIEPRSTQYLYQVTSLPAQGSDHLSSASVRSEDYQSLEPEKTLAAPTEAKWDKYAFSWKWDGEKEGLAGFELLLCRSETAESESEAIRHFYADELEGLDANGYRNLVREAVQMNGAGHYSFEVQAATKNFIKYADSGFVKSDIVYLDENTDFNVTTPPDKPSNPGGNTGGGSSSGGSSSSGGGSSKPVEPEKPPVEPENPPVEPETPATPASEKFDDVAKDSWYEAGVTYVTGKGLFQGVSDGVFAPNTNMTRAMLMTVLARLDGQETVGGATWYAKAMDWAKAQGISDGSAPDGSVTREQLVTMLYRYAKPEKAEGGLDKFADADGVSSWAKEAMEWAVANNIVTGKSGARLDPQGTATRAEVATIIQRFAEKTAK